MSFALTCESQGCSLKQKTHEQWHNSDALDINQVPSDKEIDALCNNAQKLSKFKRKFGKRFSELAKDTYDIKNVEHEVKDLKKIYQSFNLKGEDVQFTRTLLSLNCRSEVIDKVISVLTK